MCTQFVLQKDEMCKEVADKNCLACWLEVVISDVES